MPLFVPDDNFRGDYTFDPRDYGLLAAPYDPMLMTTSAALTSGAQHFIKVWIPRTITATNIMFSVATIGATLTAGANNLAVYNSAGTRLAATADQTTNYTATGVKTVPFTAPVVIPGGPGVFVWLAVKSTGTTPVSLHRATVVQSNAAAAFNLTPANLRFATNGTVTTALLPATITPASNIAANSVPFLALT